MTIHMHFHFATCLFNTAHNISCTNVTLYCRILDSPLKSTMYFDHDYQHTNHNIKKILSFYAFTSHASAERPMKMMEILKQV